jgi:putative phosphoserine phosphatase/1-acylglycerol-3-phosphate O-acyltransferase
VNALIPIDERQAFVRSTRAMRALGSLFARFDFPDRLDAPVDTPVVFAGNHRSFFDVVVAFAVFGALDVSSHILVRADVFDRPVAGHWLRATGCIPTSSKTRVAAERRAVELLRVGHGVAMMPEGRLVPPEDRPSGVGNGRPGVARIAREAGAVIMPVAVHGTDLVWPRGQPVPRPRRKRPVVTVRIGAPIRTRQRDDVVVTDEVMSTLATMLASIDRTSPRG